MLTSEPSSSLSSSPELYLLESLQSCSSSTVWRVIFVRANFHAKSEKALKINFCSFKFRDSNQSRGMALLHKQ